MFTLNGLVSFEGISTSTWNGFEIPVFTSEVAVEVLNTLLEANEIQAWNFDSENNAFCVLEIDDTEAVSYPFVNGGYAIGGCYWTWRAS